MRLQTYPPQNPTQPMQNQYDYLNIALKPKQTPKPSPQSMRPKVHLSPRQRSALERWYESKRRGGGKRGSTGGTGGTGNSPLASMGGAHAVMMGSASERGSSSVPDSVASTAAYRQPGGVGDRL